MIKDNNFIIVSDLFLADLDGISTIKINNSNFQFDIKRDELSIYTDSDNVNKWYIEKNDISYNEMKVKATLTDITSNSFKVNLETDPLNTNAIIKYTLDGSIPSFIIKTPGLNDSGRSLFPLSGTKGSPCSQPTMNKIPAIRRHTFSNLAFVLFIV